MKTGIPIPSTMARRPMPGRPSIAARTRKDADPLGEGLSIFAGRSRQSAGDPPARLQHALSAVLRSGGHGCVACH